MKKILNLGCGRTRIKGAINVDFCDVGCNDLKVDLSNIPWPWESGSIDELYMLHFIEHFDVDKIILIFSEAHRILKPAGLLHVQVPHFSGMLALTDTTHKKVFSTMTFRMLEGGNFVFSKKLFETELLKINLLALLPSENKYVVFENREINGSKGRHPIIRKVFSPFIGVIQLLISASPVFFERIWRCWVGGADEIIYRGRKV
jgi:SAM-dependent methyltransferase